MKFVKNFLAGIGIILVVILLIAVIAVAFIGDIALLVYLFDDNFIETFLRVWRDSHIILRLFFIVGNILFVVLIHELGASLVDSFKDDYKYKERGVKK